MKCGCGCVSAPEDHVVSYPNHQPFAPHAEQAEHSRGFSLKFQATMRSNSLILFSILSKFITIKD